MSTIYSFILISVGSFLEVYYYSYRFMADGLQIWLSTMIGIGLTAMLNSFFIMKDKRVIMVGIASILIVFSILSTSAGQSMSLTEKQVSAQIESNDSQIELLQSRLKVKKDRYDVVSNLLNVSVQSFDDYWEWRNTTEKYENEQNELDKEISDLQQKIISLQDPVIDLKEDKNNIYYFYNDLFGAPVKWSQFFMQTLLSAFIASMAPIGIIMLRRRKVFKEKTKVVDDIEKSVRSFVTISWYPLKAKRSNAIINKKTALEYDSRHDKLLTDGLYDTILKLAVKSGTIDRDGTILVKEEDKAVNKILHLYNTGKSGKKSFFRRA